jgi:sugar phosphate isomerase/epimerase
MNKHDHLASVSPNGESFPLPNQRDYELEFERLKKLVNEQKAMGREIVVVMGLGFVGAVTVTGSALDI